MTCQSTEGMGQVVAQSSLSQQQKQPFYTEEEKSTLSTLNVSDNPLPIAPKSMYIYNVDQDYYSIYYIFIFNSLCLCRFEVTHTVQWSVKDYASDHFSQVTSRLCQRTNFKTFSAIFFILEVIFIFNKNRTK
jgi:hypothetical protein